MKKASWHIPGELVEISKPICWRTRHLATPKMHLQWGQQCCIFKQVCPAASLGGSAEGGITPMALYLLLSDPQRCGERASVMAQARRLENALDVKLGQFAKLCSGYEQSYSRGESGLATDQVCVGCFEPTGSRQTSLSCSDTHTIVARKTASHHLHMYTGASAAHGLKVCRTRAFTIPTF